MTIKELKDSKQIPNIGDSELFKIVSQMLGENSSVDSLDFVLEDSMAEQIKYSPALIDMYIEQEMSKPGVDQVGQYRVVIDELKNREAAAEKLGRSEEVKHIKEQRERLEKEHAMLSSIMTTFQRDKGKLATVDLKSLQHLNKDAHAILMMAMLGDLQQLLPLVQALSVDVNNLHAEVQKAKDVQVTATPNGPSQTVEEKEPEIEIPPKPEIITEKKPQQPQPKAIKNSLQDLKNKKKIPASLKDEDLIRYCNEVLKFNPPVKDMNYVMTQAKFNRLHDSVFYQNARLRSEMQYEHKGVVDKYGELIANYQSMLDRMEGKPEFANEIIEIREMMEKLQTARTGYKDTIMGMDAQNIEQYFDFPVSNHQGISEFVSERSKAKATAQEEKAIELDAEISTLTGQVERLEKVSDKHLITRIKRDFDLNRLNKRIERLRKKQGKIKSNQRKIINANTEKYKKRMEREIAKFEREQAKIDLATQQKLNQVENLNAKKDQLARLQQKIVSLDEKRKQAGTFGKSRIDSQKKKVESRMERIAAAKKRLEAKIGKIDLSQQYQRSFNDNLAFAM